MSDPSSDEESDMKKFLALMVLLPLAACVTINIYFPAAAVEKAADRIIDEVWQAKKEAAGTPADKPAPAPAPAPAAAPAQ